MVVKERIVAQSNRQKIKSSVVKASIKSDLAIEAEIIAQSTPPLSKQLPIPVQIVFNCQSQNCDQNKPSIEKATIFTQSNRTR
jgi:hypothetical protein